MYSHIQMKEVDIFIPAPLLTATWAGALSSNTAAPISSLKVADRQSSP